MASSLKDYPIDGFFNAKSYAIVGASTKEGSLGLSIASNFMEKYHGDVFFVNPKGNDPAALAITRRRRNVRKADLQERQRHQGGDPGRCCGCGGQICSKDDEGLDGEGREMDYPRHGRLR